MITQHWKSSHTPLKDSRKELVLEFFQLAAAGHPFIYGHNSPVSASVVTPKADELYT